MIENLGTDEPQPKKELSPGHLLLQGRLQAGLTQEQVAKELYMTVHKVKALETDDYSRLSSDTFARGYIRAYANLVKVDVVLALAAYEQLIDGLKPKTVSPVQVAVVESSHRGAGQFLVVIGAFFLGLWLISVWFFDNRSETQYRVATVGISSAAMAEVKSTFIAVSSEMANETKTYSVSASAINTADVIKPAASASSSSVTVLEVATNVVSTSKLTNVTSTQSTAGSNAAVAQLNTSSSSKKTSLDEISFAFRAESWLEVSDSRGDVLATELEAAGSKIQQLIYS